MIPNRTVDLVVRFKNEEYWLKYFVEAIKCQVGVKINAIGIDNNSTDMSAEVFASLEEADCINSLKILNLDSFLPGHALNLGANAGSSPYIVNISSHCVPKMQTYLIELIQELEAEDERCVGAFGAQLPLRCSGAQNTIDLILTYPREQRIFRRTPIFNNANSIIKREIFSRFQFDNEVTNLEDVIWAKTVLEEGFELKYTPKGQVYHYHGPHQHIHFSGRAEKSLQVLLSKKWISIDKPNFLDLNQKNILLIDSPFQNELDAAIEGSARCLVGGEFIDLNINETTFDLNKFDHIMWTRGLDNLEITKFARESCEMASEVSYLDINRELVFHEFIYGRTPISTLIQTLKNKETVFLSARVGRLIFSGKENE